MNDQLAIDFDAVRAIGEEAAERCAAKAERVADFDREGARRFVLGWLRRHGRLSGEIVVDAAREHGYRPHDDRAFGAVFQSLARRGEIRHVGYTERRKGHGTGGARIWEAA